MFITSKGRPPAILTIVLGFATISLAQSGTGQPSVSEWIAGAVRWDALWGADVTTCSGRGKLSLSHELESSVTHSFRMESERHPDGVVTILPELRRLVAIRLTPDQQLASLTIEPTCETNLSDYYARLASLKESALPQDPRLQEHLRELRKEGEPTQSESSKDSNRTLGIVDIRPMALSAISKRSDWPRPKVDVLVSVEAAVQMSFDEACEIGSSAAMMIPDFELSDPAILVLIQEKAEVCVLPIGFEHRKSSGAPYTAFVKHSCIEDRQVVQKTQGLISRHRIETKTLMCGKAEIH
jgi:hypothetical protein